MRSGIGDGEEDLEVGKKRGCVSFKYVHAWGRTHLALRHGSGTDIRRTVRTHVRAEGWRSRQGPTSKTQNQTAKLPRNPQLQASPLLTPQHSIVGYRDELDTRSTTAFSCIAHIGTKQFLSQISPTRSPSSYRYRPTLLPRPAPASAPAPH